MKTWFYFPVSVREECVFTVCLLSDGSFCYQLLNHSVTNPFVKDGGVRSIFVSKESWIKT